MVSKLKEIFLFAAFLDGEKKFHEFEDHQALPHLIMILKEGELEVVFSKAAHEYPFWRAPRCQSTPYEVVAQYEDPFGE
jgi:hypothetical protein